MGTQGEGKGRNSVRKAPKRNEIRNDQIARVLGVLRDLGRLGGIDLYELAERYGTTVRTIRRDLDALKLVGFDPVEEPGEGNRKRWHLSSREQLDKLSTLLDANHYLALRMAMGQGRAVRGASNVFAALEDLSDKIETALGKAGREQLKAIDACFHSYEKFAYAKSPPDVFWPLLQAIREQRICRIHYRAPRAKSKDTEFNILPLRLFVHQDAVYLMAHVTRFNSVGVLNLQRVLQLKVTEARGKPPADFDPTAMENTAFGIFMNAKPVTYRLRFSAEVAPYIRERVWHTSQKLNELGEDGVELTFRCGETYEVSSWVASWRNGVEVLEPASLRKELASLGKALAEKYGE